RQVNLPPAAGAGACPHQVISIRRKDRQDIDTFIKSDSRLAQAIIAHQPEIVILVILTAGGVDDVLSIRMPAWAPIDAAVMRELPLVISADDDPGRAELDVGGEDLQQIVAVPVAAIDDPLAIRREKGPAIVTRGIGQ